MSKKTRAAQQAAREKALERLRAESNGRTYTSWERANAAYFWCFPDVSIMPERFTKDDSANACEDAVVWFLRHIDDANRSHPVKKAHPSFHSRLQAFNTRYPKA